MFWKKPLPNKEIKVLRKNVYFEVNTSYGKFFYIKPVLFYEKEYYVDGNLKYGKSGAILTPSYTEKEFIYKAQYEIVEADYIQTLRSNDNVEVMLNVDNIQTFRYLRMDVLGEETITVFPLS